MKFLDNLLHSLGIKTSKEDITVEEHAVIAKFDYGLETSDEFYKLVDKLRTIMDKTNVGEYDGHEMAMDLSDGYFYLYGPDADKIFETILPIFEKTAFMKNAQIMLRYGDVDCEDIKHHTVT